MPDLHVDVAVANRFISSLSKSLQALCHGCMDFDSGIEIVGYININIDSGSKVDYVLNEKVLKSTTNSMTFVSNSFLAQKDVPKQTRDGACSPIPDLRPLPQTPYYRGAYQGPRSSMHFAQSFSHRGSQKRPWQGMERDWRMSPKKYRGGRMGHHSNYQVASTSHNPPHTQSSVPGAQTTDTDFKMPLSTEGTSVSDTDQSAINVKKEVLDSDNTQQSLQSELDQTASDESSQVTDVNIKKDPDAENAENISETQNEQQTNESVSATAGDADFKGTFLHPGNDSVSADNNGETGTGDGAIDPNELNADQINQDSNLLSEQSEASNIPGEFGATSDNFSENMPSGSGDYGETEGEESYTQAAYSDAGEGSSDAGQFEVIEIEDEDEDVQGLFGDSQNFPENSSLATPASAVDRSYRLFGTSSCQPPASSYRSTTEEGIPFERVNSTVFQFQGGGRKEACPEMLKGDIIKQRKQQGLEYVDGNYMYNSHTNTYEEQARAPRTMQGRCSCKTSFSCHAIADEVRELIFDDVRNMSIEERKQYIRMHVDSLEPTCRRVQSELSRRKQSLRYHLSVGGERQRVCLNMFLATTGLRKWWILNVINHAEEERHRQLFFSEQDWGHA